jgi:hypothetical protein
MQRDHPSVLNDYRTGRSIALPYEIEDYSMLPPIQIKQRNNTKFPLNSIKIKSRYKGSALDYVA